MARKGKSTEEIIAALREAEVRIGQGETVGKICRSLGVSEQTYYKWRREYGGLKMDQAKRLKELERENERFAVPLIAIPGIKLASGRHRPASELAGAQRRPGQMLAARSFRARVVGSRAMSAA